MSALSVWRCCQLHALIVSIAFLLLASYPACVTAEADSERLDIVQAMTLSYYDLLGVSATATAKEIKKASVTHTRHRYSATRSTRPR